MINNIWVLISKKLNNEASPEELEELAQLLKEDTKGIYPVDLLSYIAKNNFDRPDPSTQPSEDKWESLKIKLVKASGQEKIEANIVQDDENTVRRFPIYKFALLVAACLLVIISVFVLKTNHVQQKDAGITEIASPKGAISNIQLPDGSKVVLNSGSKISYKNSFSSEHRDVFLSGEAFFDVVRDTRHPFIVTTQTIRIKVLGTRFNVRSYSNDKTSEAALLKGSIELTVLKNPDRQIILKPTEKVTVDNFAADLSKNQSSSRQDQFPSVELSQIHKSKLDSLPAEAIWMENKIVFDGLEFEEISKMLERKYNVSFRFKDERIRDMKFTGKFENIPLNRALKQLQVIENFHYKINDNQVIISN